MNSRAQSKGKTRLSATLVASDGRPVTRLSGRTLPFREHVNSVLLGSLLLLALVVLWPATAVAGDRFVLASGYEQWVVEDTSRGHGYVVAGWLRDELPREGRLSLVLNTETLTFRYEGLRFREGRVELGMLARAELGFAGLLPDYYERGRFVEGRGFWASYGELRGWVKWFPAHYQVLEMELGGRQYAFGRMGRTSERLVLPPDVLIIDPAVSWSYWRLENDAAWRDPHRFFPRLEGVMIRLRAGVELRSVARPWGSLREDRIVPLEGADARNAPQVVAPNLRLDAMAGTVVGEHLRLQGELSAGYMWGADDITRARVGGLNPFSVRVPGYAWAGYLADGWSVLRGEVRGIVGGSELGVAAVVGGLEDPERVASERWGMVSGLEALADIRAGAWQVDVRVGASPPLASYRARWWFSSFLALGYSWGG